MYAWESRKVVAIWGLSSGRIVKARLCLGKRGGGTRSGSSRVPSRDCRLEGWSVVSADEVDNGGGNSLGLDSTTKFRLEMKCK